jgi:hypothetical protein
MIVVPVKSEITYFLESRICAKRLMDRIEFTNQVVPLRIFNSAAQPTSTLTSHNRQTSILHKKPVPTFGAVIILVLTSHITGVPESTKSSLMQRCNHAYKALQLAPFANFCKLRAREGTASSTEFSFKNRKNKENRVRASIKKNKPRPQLKNKTPSPKV